MFDNLKAEGYKTNNKNGGYPGGVHYTVGKYIRKYTNIKILGTDVGSSKNCWFVRDL